MSDEKLNSLELDGKTFGVIGVCGIVGYRYRHVFQRELSL